MHLITDEKRLKDGRGQGSGLTYQPWIKTTDLCSKGTECCLTGTIIKRDYHFLSKLERDFFLITQFRHERKIMDLREQYPLLSLDSTRQIASEYQIRHPQMYGEDKVMTSDLVITYRDDNGRTGLAVRSLKYTSELEGNERVLEKLALEEEWWRRKGVVNWKIITEEQVNPNEAKAINHLNQFREIPQDISKFSADFLTEIKNFPANTTVRKLIEHFTDKYSLKQMNGLTLYKNLLSRKKLKIDFRIEDFGLDTSLKELKIC